MYIFWQGEASDPKSPDIPSEMFVFIVYISFLVVNAIIWFGILLSQPRGHVTGRKHLV